MLCTTIAPYSPIGPWTRDVARLKSLQNSGAFRELFRVLFTKTEKFCPIFKKKWDFLGAFLGAFEKYVEILCYCWELFQRFVSIRKLLGLFDQSWKYHRNSVLFSVLISENSQIWEISWSLGAGDTFEAFPAIKSRWIADIFHSLCFPCYLALFLRKF